VLTEREKAGGKHGPLSAGISWLWTAGCMGGRPVGTNAGFYVIKPNIYLSSHGQYRALVLAYTLSNG
jgi:hypothetical protein